MGGKQKQAQRTKNNARPSNSGRSAELLGTSRTPFVSFSNMKEAGFSSTTGFTLTADDFDGSIDSNFQVVLKKMVKKDATTKLKALQEFTELVRNTEAEAVKAILPAWPRLYCALSVDAEHRVREAAHLAHGQVVVKAKRNLAPHLKQLVGPWFTSQFDTYPPASTAATNAFQDAFPANKQQEAIVFCQDEILGYICDNLTLHTAQSFGAASKTQTSPEECGARYERALIGSLQGYAQYLNRAPVDAVRKADEANRKIVSSGRFWKLSRHETAQVRAAWFGVLTALCQRAFFVVEEETAQMVRAVVGGLDESEPAVQNSVWEAALLTITTISDWWKYINVNELFLPKLWKILKEAGYGNASTIFPNLLPLISHLPPTLDLDEFYPRFFDNLRYSLHHKSTKSSQSESRVISTTLVECLQYVILKNQGNATLCERLIVSQLIPVVESCLDNGQSAYRTMFNQISSLVQYWNRNRLNRDLTNYQYYLKVFWKNTEILLEDKTIFYADTEKARTLGEMVAKQIEFLVCLKHCVKPKRQLKVKFTGDSSSKDAPDSKDGDAELDDHYTSSLNCLVHSTCVLYVRMVTLKKVPDLLENIYTLVKEFESEALLWDVNKIVGGGETSTNLVDVYNYLLLPWLNVDKLCTKSVVDLIFLLFKYLKSDDKAEILEKMKSVKKEVCLGWCIASGLAHPYNKDVTVQKWLMTDTVGDFLVRIIKDEVNDKGTPEMSLLFKQALTENNNGDLFISKACIFQIISVLSNCLLSPSEYALTLDTCASLAAYLSSIIYTEYLALTYTDELLLAMFTLSSNVKLDMDYLTKDTLWEVNTAWQDAMVTISTRIDKSEIKTVAEKCAKILERQFFECDHSEISEDDYVEKIISFVHSVEYRLNVIFIGELLNVFFDRSFVGDWKKTLLDLAKNAEYLRGNLSYPYQTLALTEGTISDENVVKYFIWRHIIACVISTSTMEEQSDEESGEETPNGKTLYIKIADKPEVLTVNVLQDLTICESLIKNYKTMKHYNKIGQLYTSIKDKLFVILRSLDANTEENFKNHLNLKVHSECWLWARAAYTYYVEFRKHSASATYDEVLKFKNSSSTLGRLHLTQVFGSQLSYDNVSIKLNSVESIITLRSLIGCEEIDVQIAEVYNRIEKLRNEEIERYFYNVNFSNWEQMQTVIEIVRLCSSIVIRNKVSSLSRRHWDFIVISLGSWAAKLLEVKQNCRNVQIASFITSICELFASVTLYIEKLQKEQPNNSNVDEWNNVFVQSITTDILKTWLYVADHYQEKQHIDARQLPFLQELGKAVAYVNPSFIFRNRSESAPKWSKLLKRCCSLLVHREHCLQLWGYHMLIVMTPELIEVDSIAVGTNTPHEKGLIFEQFKDLLVRTHNIVQTMLIDFKLGDSCRVEPFTDSYTYTFAYLLIWDILLELCAQSSTELRFQYSDWLRKEDLLSSMLSCIFKLMPSEVLHYYDAKAKPLGEWFVKKSSLPLEDNITSEKIERLVCWVYSSTLSQLPASVRQWWSSVETRTSQIVDRVTSAYVSPHLCAQELNDVTAHENKFKNMAIKVHPSVREVVAIYTVDDTQMEMIITLPTNYPLVGPDVQCNRMITSNSHKLMLLKMCVLQQNGRIWDALCQWNNNLDKKFDGVEECYICFAVLHPGTYQLPKLSCKTCRKKFHAACLYKWFSTSNKSTCPICRNLF